MCLDGALGNMKIASDFRVIASLEQELNNLSFPGAYLFELFVHKTLHLPDAFHPPHVAIQLRLPDASGLGSLPNILHSHGQNESGNVIG